MDRFNGLDIPETLEDALDPATLALLVYDMQVGVLAQFADRERVLANVLRLLDAARAARSTVRHSSDLGYVPIVVPDACGAGSSDAAARSLDALAFAGDAMLADTDAVCAALSASGRS